MSIQYVCYNMHIYILFMKYNMYIYIYMYIHI